MARSQIEVPGAALLVLAGGVGWLLGSVALPTGADTVVLAIGLGVTVWLFIQVRRRAVHDVPAHPRRRREAVRVLLTAAAVVLVGSVLLGLTPYGELTVPLAAAVIGAFTIRLASVLDTRLYLAVGSGLMTLGSLGALLALNTAGPAGPQGLVGTGAALVLWGAAAHQVGLLDEARGRIGPR